MSPRPGRVTDIIDLTLPKERPLDIRETPEFLAIAHRVREGLRAGHSYEHQCLTFLISAWSDFSEEASVSSSGSAFRP